MVSDIKDKILDAAVQLLVEQGAAALTQPKIAAAAGVRQSHLTYYFPKRNDLLLAITLHWGKSHLEAAAQSMQPGSITLNQISEFVADRVIDAGRVRIILSLMVASEEDPRIKASLSSFVETERRSLETLLSLVDIPCDTRLRALVHAALVGVSVLNLARGPGVEQESRELTAYWLEHVVPLLAKSPATANAAPLATVPARKSTRKQTNKTEKTNATGRKTASKRK